MRIALAGNPNSGKTTLFNALTGSSQHVGNWPGVTVERKSGRLKTHREAEVIDLPGVYSLSPYSPEEIITRGYIINEKPDVIINLVDATNIERNLYLTRQIIETGVPCVIALNMIDEARARGDVIDAKFLSRELGCPVVEVSALKGIGVPKLIAAATALGGGTQGYTVKVREFSPPVEKALTEVCKQIGFYVPERSRRWFAVKFLERDEGLGIPKEVSDKIEIIAAELERELDDDVPAIIAGETYSAIEKLIPKLLKKGGGVTVSEKIDGIVTNRVLALPIFAAVMFFVYYVSISTFGAWLSGLLGGTLFGEVIPSAFGGWLEDIGANAALSSLLVDGILAGVGAVIGFLPQMIVLFACLSLLEDCGYMSRIAFILDRLFRRFGLSGKSFIPMLIGSGCGVPGIMASRTIENESDRRMTVITTTFIPCSAKIPIISMIAGLLSHSALVAVSSYLIGVGAVLVSGLMLKKTRMFPGSGAPFVMEFPPYRAPWFNNVFRSVWERAASFVKRAGTIVLAASVIIWFLQSFDWTLRLVEDLDQSILASIGGIIAPIFAPLGWGDWRLVSAAVTGLVAKETIVSTIEVLIPDWNALATFDLYAFLVFNLLCAPCFAAMGAIRREMNSGRWTAFAIGYQCFFAYCVAMIIHQLATLFSGGGFTVWTAVAWILIGFAMFLIFRPKKYAAMPEPTMNYGCINCENRNACK